MTPEPLLLVTRLILIEDCERKREEKGGLEKKKGVSNVGRFFPSMFVVLKEKKEKKNEQRKQRECCGYDGIG